MAPSRFCVFAAVIILLLLVTRWFGALTLFAWRVRSPEPTWFVKTSSFFLTAAASLLPLLTLSNYAFPPKNTFCIEGCIFVRFFYHCSITCWCRGERRVNHWLRALHNQLVDPSVATVIYRTSPSTVQLLCRERVPEGSDA